MPPLRRVTPSQRTGLVQVGRDGLLALDTEAARRWGGCYMSLFRVRDLIRVSVRGQ